MTLAEASLQNRYAQSLQPDTRLSVISYRFVFTACVSRRPFPCPDNCAGAAVGNVGKALTIFLLFFCHYLLWHQTINVCVFPHRRFSLCSLDESTLLQIVKQNTAFVFEYTINPLSPELNPICCLLALLAHHFLHVRRIRVKSLTIRLLMSYIYGAPILDVSRSYTTTHHSR